MTLEVRKVTGIYNNKQREAEVIKTDMKKKIKTVKFKTEKTKNN